MGGGIAVIVGAFLFNSIGLGQTSIRRTFAGDTSVQNSNIILTQSVFSDCLAESTTAGPESGSLGTSSVYGGAFAILHSPQLSEFRNGLLSSPSSTNLVGFNFTVIISNSNFIECRAFTTSTSVRPGTSNGGGGAVYASSMAVSNFSAIDCGFISSSVYVAFGSSGVPSNSSGGALAVEFPGSHNSAVLISSCSFLNCTAREPIFPTWLCEEERSLCTKLHRCHWYALDL